MLVPVRKSVNQLSSSLGLYLRDMRDGGRRSLTEEIRQRVDRVIYSMTQSPEEDPYFAELDDAIASIEATARPHVSKVRCQQLDGADPVLLGRIEIGVASKTWPGGRRSSIPDVFTGILS